MKGRIHSLESFGTVDGPGTRFVVFFQGCPMRCLYCHNPDTWDPKGGTEMSAEYILEQYERNIAFYSGGGITTTGGEPLLQIDFLIELYEKAKEKGIHTCLDTSGIVFKSEPIGTDFFVKISPSVLQNSTLILSPYPSTVNFARFLCKATASAMSTIPSFCVFAKRSWKSVNMCSFARVLQPCQLLSRPTPSSTNRKARSSLFFPIILLVLLTTIF